MTNGKRYEFAAWFNIDGSAPIHDVCDRVNTYGDVIEFYKDDVVVVCISKSLFSHYVLREIK